MEDQQSRGQLPQKPKQELFDLTLPLQAVFYLFTFTNTDLANPCFRRHSQQFCPQPLLVMLCRKVPSLSVFQTQKQPQRRTQSGYILGAWDSSM